MKLLEKVTAIYEPKNLNTLREESKPFIGKILTFEPLWVITKEDGGPYVGQWALKACADNGFDWLPFGWVPEEDIRIVESNSHAQ